MENNKSYEIKKTGTEKTYGAATRCSKEGKGRYDLIPEDVLSECFESYSNQSYSMFPEERAVECAINDDYVNAITYITQSKYHKCDEKSTWLMDFTKMVRDLAIHFQKGAEMYGYRNCEKGIPLWSFRDSGIRHLIQYINGETDEPHYISAIWNFVMAEWTKIHHPERCDKDGLSLNNNDDKKVEDCDNSTTKETSTTYNGTPLSEFPSLIKEYEDNHSTKTSNESNDYYCGLEHEIRESLKELGCDDNEMNGNILSLYNNKSDDPIKIEHNHEDNMYSCKNVDNVIKIHNMGSQNTSIDKNKECLTMKENSIIMRMYRPPISGHGVIISIPNDITIEKFYKKLFECIDKLGCDLLSDTIIITLTYPNDDKTTINVRFTYYAEYDSNGVSWSNSILKNIDNENELAVSYNNPPGGCVYLTKNKFGFIERHKIKLLSEIFEILCDDDEVVKSSGYNYIKPVNITDMDSSASETKEENIKTDNRFVYDELIWNPDVNIDVIRFISQYNNDDDEFSKNSRDYDGKYSYHFAKLLKSIFDRGTVCYSTCYNKFVWCDDDGLCYCVKGNICMLKSGKLIPENKIPKTIIEFFKNPNCEDYYEKLHIFGYFMKSLLSE